MISKKKRQEIHAVIHQDIIAANHKIGELIKNSSYDTRFEVFKLLCNLSFDIPERVLEILK